MTQGLFMPIYRPPRSDIYTTDFREYVVGIQPPDWTKRYATDFTATVETASGSLSGRALRWIKPAASRQALSWDRVPLAADLDILVRFRAIASWTDASNFISAYARGAGAAGTETGYRNLGYGITTNSRWAAVTGRYVSGTYTPLGSISTGPSPNYVINEWAWLRFNVSGTSLRRKMWHSAAAEPAAWAETVTDTQVSSAGWCGLNNAGGNPDTEVDFFGVGLNGQTVPLPV